MRNDRCHGALHRTSTLRTSDLVKPANLLFAVALIAITPKWTSAQCLTHESIASDASSGDNFGFKVALSGNLAAVGARFDDAGAVNSGSVYVFRFDPLTGAWAQEAKLVAPDAGAGDEFGFAVDIHSNQVTGDRIVVGARHDDDKGTDSGSAYFFKKVGTSWNLISKVTASDGAAGDRFGFAVAIAGDHAMITARDDDAPATNTGSVYAFHFNGTTWTQYVKLVPADVASNDQFGHSVAMTLAPDGSGAHAVVGSWHDDAPGTNSGSAYIYGFSNQSGIWNQQAKLTAADAAANDEFGISVAICPASAGEVVVVGARNNDDNGADSGSAYVFKHVATAWPQQAKLLASDAAAGDQFGQSVAIAVNGSGIIVGANTEDQGGLDAGAAYTFWQLPADQTWAQSGKLMASNALAGDQFGTSVAAGNDRGVVGCHLSDLAGSDSGSVHFYGGISGTDMNDNGLPDGCDLQGDVNGDGFVNITDLSILVASWGVCSPFPEPCVADLDGNGAVEVTDVIIVVNNWS